MEDFVTYDVAVKLKEKGFKEECLAYYTTEYTLYNNEITLTDNKYLFVSNIDYEEFLVSHNSIKYTNGNYVDAPTISQVLKWLRKEKDIDIVISPVFFYDGVLGKMREYGCKVFTPSLNKPEHCGYQEEWEQAAIAGIEYALDNFI